MEAHIIQNILTEKHQISVSCRTVSGLLEILGYSKQANQKMLQAGKPNPSRNEQFEFINAKVKEFTDAGGPVISNGTGRFHPQCRSSKS